MGKSGASRAAIRDGKRKASKAKASKAQGPASAVLQGPVPIKKVPSLRGRHQLGLHAAGGFLTKAPSPNKLPPPPPHWREAQAFPRCAFRHARSDGLETSLVAAPPALQRSASVVRELQGNLLHLTLTGRFPELAGKVQHPAVHVFTFSRCLTHNGIRCL